MEIPMRMLNAAKQLRSYLDRLGIFNEVVIDDPPHRNKLGVHLVNPEQARLLPKRWRSYPVEHRGTLPWQIAIPTDQDTKQLALAPMLPQPSPPTTTGSSS